MNAHNEQSSVVEKVAAEMREFYDAEMAPDDDVLKSWIDRLAAQPSPVVKQNLTTQPAAAQEAVGEMVCRASGITVPQMYGSQLPAGTKLYAAPVAAAPADNLHAHLLHMLGAKDHEDAGRIIGELHAATMRTPAAPGIDLPYSIDADPAGIRSLVADLITGTLMVGAQGHSPPPTGHWLEPFWLAARSDSTLIDASPKGDPEHGRIDPSWSLHDRVEFALRDAGFDLDEAAFVAEAASVANGDLDSPKGGSDALDATRLDWLDANGFTAYRQIDPIDGLSPHCVVVHETQLPRRGNVHDTIRGAIDAAMQAQANSHGAGVRA